MAPVEIPRVADLLPHQPPMRLLDRVLAWDANQVWALAMVDEEMPFATAAGLRACYGLELVAQAAAAFFTLCGGDESPPRQGMLIASRSFTTRLSHYPLPCRLLIHARLASPLPPDAAGSALVKFTGDIVLLEDVGDAPAQPDALQALCDERAITEVNLSVYL